MQWSVEFLLEMELLQSKLGWSFNQFGLLEKALTHSSWANQHHDESNERLEFLGDAVLDLLSAEYLMAKLTSAKEGELSQARASLVKASSLAECARRINLGSHLIVSSKCQYLREVDNVLADAMEAVVAAAYLDGGLGAARAVAIKVGILK